VPPSALYPARALVRVCQLWSSGLLREQRVPALLHAARVRRVSSGYRRADRGESGDLRLCANHARAGCNWAIEPGESGPLCRSCRLTRARPADSDPDGLAAVADAERAKRRLLFQLLDLGLPVEQNGLLFDLLSSRCGRVVTGHDDGLITDRPRRVPTTRNANNDAARSESPTATLVGHFRHEIGHYYEPILVDAQDEREPTRALFGDERGDYEAALRRHYAHGPPADWA
jgi:hypothetical protein